MPFAWSTVSLRIDSTIPSCDMSKEASETKHRGLKRKYVDSGCTVSPEASHHPNDHEFKASIVEPSRASVTQDSSALATEENGHRFGNFHNYYSFNPVENRTSLMRGILDWIVSEWNFRNKQKITTFYYTDIGCNEGDLTMEFARLLHNRFLDSLDVTATSQSSETAQSLSPNGNHDEALIVNSTSTTLLKASTVHIHVTGIDLDSILIERARQKIKNDIIAPTVNVQFRATDVLQNGILSEDTSTTLVSNTKSSSFTPSKTMADLTTLFSTTMWIHIHGGDDGLRRVLRQVCETTRFFLVLEIQPSKCYGTAAARLRRLGLNPLCVSTERLQLRANIEASIEAMLSLNGFERAIVGMDSKDQGKNSLPCHSRTSWNRSLRFYQRVGA